MHFSNCLKKQLIDDGNLHALQQEQPFCGHYTGQPALAGTSS